MKQLSTPPLHSKRVRVCWEDGTWEEIYVVLPNQSQDFRILVGCTYLRKAVDVTVLDDACEGDYGILLDSLGRPIGELVG